MRQVFEVDLIAGVGILAGVENSPLGDLPIKPALVKVVAISGFGIEIGIFGGDDGGIGTGYNRNGDSDNPLLVSPFVRGRNGGDGVSDKAGLPEEGQVANRDILVDDLLG